MLEYTTGNLTLDESGRLLWCADVGRLPLLLILDCDLRFSIMPSSICSELVDLMIESLSLSKSI